MKSGRRLIVGDLHGCLDELKDLLARFGFDAHADRLYSVGDVAGKGPKVAATFKYLRELGAGVVRGNHDEAFWVAHHTPADRRSAKMRAYLEGVGPHREECLADVAGWPYHLDLGDVLVVHAGLQPGVEEPGDMDPRLLMNIRTWDGRGDDLVSESNPAWFELVRPAKTVAFGHWAKRGLVDLPGYKGLDTGCVYGRVLTGWCPEENTFYQVKSRGAYAPITRD